MSDIHKMYSKYKQLSTEYFKEEQFYEQFMKAIKSGSNNFSLYQKYLDHEIDIKWVEEIESCVIPLDNIIRNPQRFIQNLEEIVPIEQARKITDESLRHLAQHTSMIAKVDKDGSVTPNKILNVFKEETFATYENRFIYTLLHNLQYFIDKRLKILQEAKTQSEYKLNVQNEFSIGNETIKYELSLTSIEDIDKSKVEIKLDEDTSNMTIKQRVERLRRILYDFQNSALIKSLAGTALIKPPVVRTNVILKNPNFKKALQTWQFIERYNEAGLIVKMIEKEQLPSNEYMDDLLDNLTMNYVTFAHHNKPNKELLETDPNVKEFTPNLITHIVESYIDEYEIDIEKVEKVFVDQIKKITARHKENEAKVKKALDRVITREKERLAKLKAMENDMFDDDFIDEYEDEFDEEVYDDDYIEDYDDIITRPHVEEVSGSQMEINESSKQDHTLSVNLKETEEIIEEKDVIENVIVEEDVKEIIVDESDKESEVKQTEPTYQPLEESVNDGSTVNETAMVSPIVVENLIIEEKEEFKIIKRVDSDYKPIRRAIFRDPKRIKYITRNKYYSVRKKVLRDPKKIKYKFRKKLIRKLILRKPNAYKIKQLKKKK